MDEERRVGIDVGVTDRPTAAGACRRDADGSRRKAAVSVVSVVGEDTLRFLPTGNAGRGPVGGASGGREVRCMFDAMVPADGRLLTAPYSMQADARGAMLLRSCDWLLSRSHCHIHVPLHITCVMHYDAGNWQ